MLETGSGRIELRVVREGYLEEVGLKNPGRGRNRHSCSSEEF